MPTTEHTLVNAHCMENMQTTFFVRYDRHRDYGPPRRYDEGRRYRDSYDSDRRYPQRRTPEDYSDWDRKRDQVPAGVSVHLSVGVSGVWVCGVGGWGVEWSSKLAQCRVHKTM